MASESSKSSGKSSGKSVSNNSGPGNPTDEQMDEWMNEQEWHIANATTDFSQFMKELSDGQQLDDVAVFTAEGEALQLASVWAEKPALILTGSMTCPPSRQLNPAANALRERFADQFNVVLLYVIDAHPDGDLCPYTGTDWLTKDNEEAGVRFRQPLTQDDRNSMARDYRERLGLKVPVLVDNMDNAAWIALGRSPNTAVLINTDGRVSHSQVWFRPEDLVTGLS